MTRPKAASRNFRAQPRRRRARPLLAAARPPQPRFLLAFPGVLFDQGRACGKDRGKGKKQTPKVGRDKPSDDRYGSAEHESDEILGPVRLTKRGKLELNGS
jgi:hypothetical protein